MMGCSMLCATAVLGLAVAQLVAGKIISCGGFVKSNVPGMDLSSVQVKLFTAEGNLKYETECNPSTGYYMIPVYNKGKYRLQVVGPAGWIFGGLDPDSQALEIIADDDDGPCTDDINFQLFGFTVSGQVTDASGAGQAGLSIVLRSNNGDPIDTTVTNPTGTYEFKARPGSYVLSTLDSTGGVQCVDRGTVSVEVTKLPVSVKPDIRITGQNLPVTVRDETEVVVSGATVSLISARKLSFKSAAQKGQPKETKESPTSWLYSAHSNVDGMVLFPCIPSGEYALKVEWSSSDAKLNFAAKKMSVVGQSPIPVTLTAESFDAFSRLTTTPSGAGIGQAEIIVDGERVATTDSEGRYALKGLKAKIYQLGARKPQYEFASAEWAASSSVPVPQLQITAFAVCGKVEFGEKDGRVRLRVIGENGKFIDNIDVVTESGGKFCRVLPPGRYQLEPEQTHGQTFAPTTIAVDIRDSPYLNAKFSQFQASIAGRVVMMEDAGGAAIKLRLFDGDALLKEIKPTKQGTFQFDGVSPGSYQVRVVDDDTSTLWWEKGEQAAKIVDRSVTDLVFRQTGYRAQIDSTHVVHLKCSLASTTQGTDLKVGRNEVFFPARGQWKVEVVDSCHEFIATTDESWLHVPTAKSAFKLSAKSSQLFVSVTTEGPAAASTRFGITLQELDESGEKIVLDEATKVVGKTGFTFAFHLKHASSGHRFSITPRSSEYLFSPTSTTYTFDGECGKSVANFKATVGKFIEGAVSPPVAKARVTATRDESEMQGETDKQGRYRLGPVWDTTGFAIGISKEGYEFERSLSSPTRFKAVRLSQLRLNLRDEDGGKALAEVLISLSGPNNYRSNVVVDQSGTHSFIGLAPGEYFVRPILLEYRFTSTSTSVIMREGEVQELTLGAKRIAYSVFGRVTALDGQRVSASVRVEAVSTQCENHQEEDEFDGSRQSEFRIRGLKPECLYCVRVKEAKTADEHTTWSVYPPYASVQANHQDKHGINFILTPAVANRYTLIGRVHFDRTPSSVVPSTATAASYMVELYRVGEPSPLAETQVTIPGTAFVMPDLELVANESYSVSIRKICGGGTVAELRKSDAAKLKIQPLESVFTADSSPVIYVKLRAEKDKRSADADQSSKSNYLGFVIVILITVAFFFKQETLKSVASRAAGAVRSLLDKLMRGNAAAEHERRLLKKANRKNG